MKEKMQTIIPLGILGICLILFVIFILQPPINPIEEFTEKNVVSATGISFKTRMITVLDPRTQQVIPFCIPSEITKENSLSEKHYLTRPVNMKKSNLKKCDAQLNVDSNPTVNTALELSKKPIKGKVKNKQGKVVDADYVVTVEALFTGSECSSVSNGGNRTENCIPPPPGRP